MSVYDIDAQRKGEVGEETIAYLLSGFNRSQFIVLNNILLNKPFVTRKDVPTVQIDHIVVSLYGIFVIETKNYRGKIYGYEDAKNWYTYMGGQKFTFQNPIMQNYGHGKVIGQLIDRNASKVGMIGVQYPVHQIVAFSDYADISRVNADPRFVAQFFRVPDAIMNLCDDVYLTYEQMEAIASLIQSNNIYSPEAMKKHIESIKEQKEIPEDNTRLYSSIQGNEKEKIPFGFQATTQEAYVKAKPKPVEPNPKEQITTEQQPEESQMQVKTVDTPMGQVTGYTRPMPQPVQKSVQQPTPVNNQPGYSQNQYNNDLLQNKYQQSILQQNVKYQRPVKETPKTDAAITFVIVFLIIVFVIIVALVCMGLISIGGQGGHHGTHIGQNQTSVQTTSVNNGVNSNNNNTNNNQQPKLVESEPIEILPDEVDITDTGGMIVYPLVDATNDVIYISHGTSKKGTDILHDINDVYYDEYIELMYHNAWGEGETYIDIEGSSYKTLIFTAISALANNKDDTTVKIQVVNKDTEEILYESDELEPGYPVDVEVNIRDIDNIRMNLIDEENGYSTCFITNLYLKDFTRK